MSGGVPVRLVLRLIGRHHEPPRDPCRATTFSGTTSAGPAAMLEPGVRLLVAGDGRFVWSCGFTQPYQTSVARQWRNVFNR